MPFTLSHVAAALPLRRLPLVWSAFVVGSMAPDFPYIIGNTDYRGLGHQWPGVVEFTFPAAIFALWLFHTALKRPAATLLPPAVRRRLAIHLGDFQFGGAARFAAILISIALGIATHLIWDAFTHAFSWPWRRWAWMQLYFKLPRVGLTPIYRILQYGSTVFGLLALGVWIWLWYRRTTPNPGNDSVGTKSGPVLVGAMVALALAIGFLRAWMLIGIPRNMEIADSFFLVFGVTSIALVFWQVILYCVMISSHQTWTIS
jgi:hypothetical protein